MWRKILLKVISWLYSFTYEAITLDKINQKLIRPVPGLIVKGEQYFEFENIADMPETRRAEYQNLREEAVMGITRELLVDIFDGQIKAIDSGELSKAASIAFMAKDMIANITSKEILYKLASLMYFTDREDISTYDLDFNNKKIELFKQIEQQGFFFGRLLDNGSSTTGDPLRPDIQKFLKESEVREKSYLRVLSAMLEKSVSNNTAPRSTRTAKESKAT